MDNPMQQELEKFTVDSVHTFTVRGDHFLFHAPRFRVYKIDKFASDVIRALADPKVSRDSVLNDYPHDELDELISGLRRLEIVVDRSQVGDRHEPDLPKAGLSCLTLNISNACNLRCRYCSATQVTERPQLMSKETAERSIDFLLSHTKEASVGFFGGEPLLNFDVLRHAVEYGTARADETGADLRWSLTTNGTRIDDTVVDFLRRHPMPVICSIDGDPQAHDAARRYPDGGGSYADVAASARRLLAERLPSVWARATISTHNLDLERVVAHLHELGFSHITTGFASMIDYSGNDSFCRPLNEDEIEHYRERLIATAEYLVRHIRDDRPAWGIDLGYYINAIHNIRPRYSACGAGVTMAAVSPDGRLYPCSRFDGMDDYEMGDVFSGITRQAPFDGDAVTRADCHDCWARYLCGGGCWADVRLTKDREYAPLLCRLWQYKAEVAVWLYYQLKQLPSEVLGAYCRQVGGTFEEHVSKL